MMQRTLAAIRDGSYDYTAVLGLLVAVAGLIVEAAAQLDGLPAAIQPLVMVLTPYARLVVLLGGVVAAQGRSLLVRA
jgi:hypothetical protein